MKSYNYRKNKRSRKEKIGFFTAFSVCMVAIALALWSTYASIGGLEGNTVDKEKTTYSVKLSDLTQPADNQVTGVTEPTTFTEETTVPTTTSSEEITEPETEFPDASFAQEDTLQTILQVSESLIYPVSSKRVVKEYSEQPVYSETMGDYRVHPGTDFAADVGENLLAVCDGIIDDVSYDDMYGKIIKLTNGNFCVYYCGVFDEVMCIEGESVSAGDIIGKVGTVPCEAEDEMHLHIEVRVGGNSIDPMTVISNDL